MTSPDHAAAHSQLNNVGSAIEVVLGTNGGTAVLKNFLVGDFAARINSETHGSITVNKGTLGTVLINNSTYSGGTVNGTVTNTNVITGGTINTFTMGTPTLIGGTIVVSGTVTPEIRSMVSLGAVYGAGLSI